MKGKDTYKTIKKPSEGLYKEKGSRFLAFAYPVETRIKAEERINELRKKYHDARHHCFAWVIKSDRSDCRSNDDGEPSNSAGQPILGQINANQLTNILIVVVRYFGGTLLGVGGLIRAYRSAAADAIEKSEIITRTINRIYQLNFSYDLTGSVMKIVQSPGINVLEQKFDERVMIKISIRKSLAEGTLNKLKSVVGLEVEHLGAG